MDVLDQGDGSGIRACQVVADVGGYHAPTEAATGDEAALARNHREPPVRPHDDGYRAEQPLGGDTTRQVLDRAVLLPVPDILARIEFGDVDLRNGEVAEVTRVRRHVAHPPQHGVDVRVALIVAYAQADVT